MVGITRGVSTLVGAAVAVFLIWLATQMSSTSESGFWATYGLVAAAGLTMALSQIIGGWTKWGWPRLAPGVFVLGFLPLAIVTLWVLFARQPGDALLNTGSWSRSIGVDGVVSDLGELLAALVFLGGLTFGLTFDTTGPRRVVSADGDRLPAEARVAADEPITAERRVADDGDPEAPTRERTLERR